MDIVSEYIKKRAERERGYCMTWFSQDTGISIASLAKHKKEPTRKWSMACARIISEYTNGELSMYALMRPDL